MKTSIFSIRKLFIRAIPLGLIIIVFALLVLPVFASSDVSDYSIQRWSIDGGGGTSGAGSYTLTGTIGQPDAGGQMTDGSYALSGGFFGIGGFIEELLKTFLPAVFRN
jgi:hypothetical protein